MSVKMQIYYTIIYYTIILHEKDANYAFIDNVNNNNTNDNNPTMDS